MVQAVLLNLLLVHLLDLLLPTVQFVLSVHNVTTLHPIKLKRISMVHLGQFYAYFEKAVFEYKILRFTQGIWNERNRKFQYDIAYYWDAFMLSLSISLNITDSWYLIFY